jgi:hypothetical protein
MIESSKMKTCCCRMRGADRAPHFDCFQAPGVTAQAIWGGITVPVDYRAGASPFAWLLMQGITQLYCRDEHRQMEIHQDFPSASPWVMTGPRFRYYRLIWMNGQAKICRTPGAVRVMRKEETCLKQGSEGTAANHQHIKTLGCAWVQMTHPTDPNYRSFR